MYRTRYGPHADLAVKMKVYEIDITGRYSYAADNGKSFEMFVHHTIISLYSYVLLSSCYAVPHACQPHGWLPPLQRIMLVFHVFSI